MSPLGAGPAQLPANENFDVFISGGHVMEPAHRGLRIVAEAAPRPAPARGASRVTDKGPATRILRRVCRRARPALGRLRVSPRPRPVRRGPARAGALPLLRHVTRPGRSRSLRCKYVTEAGPSQTRTTVSKRVVRQAHAMTQMQGHEQTIA